MFDCPNKWNDWIVLELDLPRAQTSTLEEYVFEDDSSLARFLEE